jgi:hypothetical protein
MTWRRFWYSWAYMLLKNQRERIQAENHAEWLMTVQISPKSAQTSWGQLHARGQQTEEALLLTLYEELPRSARILLMARPTQIETKVDAVSQVIAYWDEQIARYARNPRQAAFYEGGKQEALAKLNNKPRVH